MELKAFPLIAFEDLHQNGEWTERSVPLDIILNASSGCPGNRRLVSWATLAESVTIRHFRSEDFPVEQDTSAIWQVRETPGSPTPAPSPIQLECPFKRITFLRAGPEAEKPR